MQLFGGVYTEAHGFSPTPCSAELCEGGLMEKPHFHFDYCGPAMITIFILLTVRVSLSLPTSRFLLSSTRCTSSSDPVTPSPLTPHPLNIPSP